MHGSGHELVLSSVAVPCVRQARVSFSLVRLDGVSLLVDVGKDREDQKRLLQRWLCSREISASHSNLLPGPNEYFIEVRNQNTKENLPQYQINQFVSCEQ